MNENRHPIDDLFRDGLDQHSVEPPMHVWDRIDQTRTPVYKLMNNFKQHSSWYLSVAAGLVFMSAAAVMFLSDSPENRLGQSGTNTTAPVQVEQRMENSSETNPNTSTLAAESKDLEIANATAPKVSQANEVVHVQGDFFTPTPRKNATQTETTPTHETPIVVPPVIEAPTRTAPAELPVTEPQQAEVPEPVDVIAEAPTAAPRTTPTELGKGVEKAPEMGDATTQSNDPAEAPEKNEKQETKNAIPLEPSPWSIEVLGSYDFVNRRMPNATPAYAAARKQDEKVQSAFSFQLRAQYRLSSVLSLRSGIAYSRINETLNHTKVESYSEITDRQVTGYIVDPINGPQQVTYTVRDTINHSSSTQVNSNNRYTFVDVPVLLNYTLFTSNKWAVGVSGGPMFNLVFQQKGHILSPNNEEVIDLSTSANPYRTYAGVNLMLNASASYSLNKHFDLLFEPGMRYGLSSLTNAPSGMIQKNNSFNLFTGVRYNF